MKTLLSYLVFVSLIQLILTESKGEEIRDVFKDFEPEFKRIHEQITKIEDSTKNHGYNLLSGKILHSLNKFQENAKIARLTMRDETIIATDSLLHNLKFNESDKQVSSCMSRRNVRLIQIAQKSLKDCNECYNLAINELAEQNTILVKHLLELTELHIKLDVLRDQCNVVVEKDYYKIISNCLTSGINNKILPAITEFENSSYKLLREIESAVDQIRLDLEKCSSDNQKFIEDRKTELVPIVENCLKQIRQLN